MFICVYLCLVMFICKLECSINESKLRNLIFEILKEPKKENRSLWGWKYQKCKFCTISNNPKKYFEKFKNLLLNKRNKEARKDPTGMNFENYAERIH